MGLRGEGRGMKGTAGGRRSRVWWLGCGVRNEAEGSIGMGCWVWGEG